ncbi:MAG: hypothetical protein ACJ77K_11930 [Bacteroidia bacterium]|jgi:hypothetical protein
MLNRIIGLLVIVLLYGGCKKYPDDTSSSIWRTAKARLTEKKWFTNGAKNELTGVDYSGSPGNDYIQFFKSGEFNGECSQLFKFNGNWRFQDSKNSIQVYNSVRSLTFTIQELDSKTLKLRNDSLASSYHRSQF